MIADSEAAGRGHRMNAARARRRLETAERAYRERFGADAPISSYIGHPRVADALMDAVESGKPLTIEALAKWLGDAHSDRWSGS